MTPLLFCLLMFAGSVFAGFVGALLGLGGGIIVVPMLTLAMGIDIRFAIGTSISFWHHREYLNSPDSLRQMTGANAQFPHDLRAVADAAFHGYGRGWAITGLLTLIGTPVLRVAMTLFIFLFERDRAYTLLSAAVLTLLAISFFLGHVGG